MADDGGDKNMLQSMSHDLHRSRRQPLAPFFSKASIRRLDPVVQEKADMMIDRLKTSAGTGAALNLSDVYSALTLDVISHYCFGESMGQLESPQWGKAWLDLLHQGVQTNPFTRQFPWLMNRLKRAPVWLLKRIQPQLGLITGMRKTIVEKIKSIDHESVGTLAERTIFHAILDSDMPESEKTPERLAEEAFVFLAAGTEVS